MKRLTNSRRAFTAVVAEQSGSGDEVEVRYRRRPHIKVNLEKKGCRLIGYPHTPLPDTVVVAPDRGYVRVGEMEASSPGSHGSVSGSRH